MAERGVLGRHLARNLTEITLKKVTGPGFQNAERHTTRIREGQSILALRSTPLMEGDAAIIIGAGPSLHRTNVAEQIRNATVQPVLIACESVLAYSFRNGLIPDLVVTLDPHPTRIVRCLGDPTLTPERLPEDDYFARQDFDPGFAEDQLRFNAELIGLVNRYGPQIRAAISSSAAPAVVDRIYESGMEAFWWNPYYDDVDVDDSLTRKIHRLNGLPCLNAGGNVGTAAWVIAHTVLKKRKIALVGMDLSYYAETPYLNTQHYYELIDLVGLDRLDEVFIPIHNPHVGMDFYTDPVYLWYRDCFLEMLQQANGETFNCTGGGILFGSGVHITSLAEFLAAICPVQVNATREGVGG